MSFGCVLAEIPDFGSVFDCGDCGNIHVALGGVSLTLSSNSFLQLVTLIHSSAANFEVWMSYQEKSKAKSISLPKNDEESKRSSEGMGY